MKHLRLFKELYGNAGSMYGWDKVKVDTSFIPTKQYPSNGKVIDYKKTYPYKCNDCDMEFRSFDVEDVMCQNCGSENVEPINYINNETFKNI